MKQLGIKRGKKFTMPQHKNYATAEEVSNCVRQAIVENKIENLTEFLALVEASSHHIEKVLGSKNER